MLDATLARLRVLIPPGSAKSYGFALFCVGGASLFELLLKWLDQNNSRLVAYYPAVAFTALLGGIGPAALVAVVGEMTAW